MSHDYYQKRNKPDTKSVHKIMYKFEYIVIIKSLNFPSIIPKISSSHLKHHPLRHSVPPKTAHFFAAQHGKTGHTLNVCAVAYSVWDELYAIRENVGVSKCRNFVTSVFISIYSSRLRSHSDTLAHSLTHPTHPFRHNHRHHADHTVRL